MTPNSVSGTILSSAGGNVGSGATVTIGGTTAATDTNGSYTIYAVPAGTDNVSITAPAFVSYNAATSIIMGANSGVNFTVTADSLNGTVLSSQGGNVGSGAYVNVDGLTATTDSNGQFSMNTVTAGSHNISISQSGYAPYGTTFSTSSGSNTHNFTITANSVSGTVYSSADGEVIAGAIVTIGNITGTTNSSGQYTVYTVPAGSQSVNITATGHVNYSSSCGIASGTNNGVDFTLTANHVTGTVLASQGGNAGSGAIVTISGISDTTRYQRRIFDLQGSGRIRRRRHNSGRIR